MKELSAAPPLDAEGERLWREVEAVFADPARHDRFVQHCTLSAALPAAARRYRDWLTAHPGDPVATKLIQRITFLAIQPFSQPPRPAPRRWDRRKVWLVILVAAALGAVAGAMQSQHLFSRSP